MNTEPTNEIRGALGLLLIWSTWLAGNLDFIQQVLQIIATVVAIGASLLYGWYYYRKNKKENG